MNDRTANVISVFVFLVVVVMFGAVLLYAPWRDAVGAFSRSGVTLNHFLALGGVLFLVGIYGVLTRTNLIAILMSVEIMLNAAMMNFVAISAYTDPQNIQGQLFALFIVAIAAAEVAVGLAIFINVFRSKGGLTPDDLMEMKA